MRIVDTDLEALRVGDIVEIRHLFSKGTYLAMVVDWQDAYHIWKDVAKGPGHAQQNIDYYRGENAGLDSVWVHFLNDDAPFWEGEHGEKPWLLLGEYEWSLVLPETANCPECGAEFELRGNRYLCLRCAHV